MICLSGYRQMGGLSKVDGIFWLWFILRVDYFFFSSFFLLYVCMIDNSITFFGVEVQLITDGWYSPSKSERSIEVGVGKL